MPGQLIPGNINRVRGNILVPANSSLNITAAYMGQNAIRYHAQNPASVRLRGLTASAISEEPYQIVLITVSVMKSLALSSVYLAQIQKTSSIGQVTVTPDTGLLPLFTIQNASIANWAELNTAGTQADFDITFEGDYFINNNLWSG